MKYIPRVCYGILLWGVIFPLTLAAQSPTSPVLTDQQKMGKGLFLQNCSLCHLPNRPNVKSTEEGTSVGPRLNGRLSGPKPLPEAVARTFIQKGVEGKMPGFQYGLEPKEIDAIIAYLKTL